MNKLMIPALMVAAALPASAFAFGGDDYDGYGDRPHCHSRHRAAVVEREVYEAPVYRESRVYEEPRVVYRERVIERERPVVVYERPRYEERRIVEHRYEPAVYEAPQPVYGAAYPVNADRAVGQGVGAVIGGIIGNQMGRGHGRTATTVIGAIAGATIGGVIADQNAREQEVRYSPAYRY